jgi:hypothetical protein
MYYDDHLYHEDQPATERQRRVLYSILPANMHGRIPRMTKAVANLCIAARQQQWSALPPTDQQIAFLRRHHAWRDGIKRGEASEIISTIKKAQLRDDPPPLLAERSAGRPLPTESAPPRAPEQRGQQDFSI